MSTWRPWFRAFCLLAMSVPAAADDDPLVFSGLGYSGDGVTPTFGDYVSILAAQTRPAQHLATAGPAGGLSTAIEIETPDALLPGDLRLSYASSAGGPSWIARGWSIDSGITIRALTAREKRGAYADTPDLYQISGGVEGLLEPVEAATYSHRLVSEGGGYVVADYDEIAETWTVWSGPVTISLAPRIPGALRPQSWRTESLVDESSNEVLYTYTGTRLDRIEFGGNALSTDDQWPPTVRIDLHYDPIASESVRRSFAEGVEEAFDERLSSVEVFARKIIASGWKTVHRYELDYADDREESFLVGVRREATTGPTKSS